MVPKIRSTALATLLCVVMVLPAFAQVKTPDTPGGKRVAAYLTAFNSGDEAAMRAFFEKNISAEALKTRSIDDRIQIYKQMHQRLETLRLDRVTSADSQSITALIQSHSGEWLDVTFLLDGTPEQKLVALRVEQTEPPQAGDQNSVPSTPLTADQFAKAADSYLDSLVKQDLFSGTVLVGKQGVQTYSKACGLASIEFQVPNRLDTKFNLGSINKSFTKVAICQLADQGKLSFDDTIGKYLPDYPNADARARVTIKQLLTMKSGIGDFFGDRFEATPKEHLRTLGDYLKLFADQPLQFEPGTNQKYSNGGFIVLGVIIEKVTGMTYYDYVKKYIWEPAGMTNTDYYESDVPTQNRATGYTTERPFNVMSSAKRIDAIFTRPARGSSAGGGYSTAPDLLLYANALRDYKLLSPRAAHWMMDSDFDISHDNKTPAAEKGVLTTGGLGIAGGSPGTNAALDVDFASGNVVVALSNYDPPVAEQVARYLRKLVERVK
jgi:CubicO group peptidase (beta-lactamase class C family)